MALQVLFALLAGVLTIGAPCILPLLPILLGTSVGQNNKTRPLFIVGGFILVFTILGLFISYLTNHLGLNPNTLRSSAIVILGLFGLLLIWPTPFELLTLHLNKIINRANEIGQKKSGNLGAFILGMTLGVIWTPCAGPVLGIILTLIATQANVGRAAVLLIAYAIGAGIPMLIIAYGSQIITTKVRFIARYSKPIQQIFGVLIILLAIAMHFNLDIKLQSQLANILPVSNLEQNLNIADFSQNKKTENIQLSDYGQAPEFAGITKWLNSDPLTMQQLRGKVVLIDFWTYSCINCIRTLPYVTKWYDTYKNQGLVVIGVHTPEFEFEKDTQNVSDAIKRFKINYPVAQDNNFATWKAYSNQYWPAEYLIDQNGHIVYTHFGEGNYDHTENIIRKLLGLDMTSNADAGANLSEVKSPEMYFGTDRLEFLSDSQSPASTSKEYTLPAQLKLNNFALGGQWQFTPESIISDGENSKIRLKFHSGKVHIVAESPNEQTVSVSVDGVAQPSVTIKNSALYTLFDSQSYNDHVIEITIPHSGFKAFTFTFG